MEPKRYAWGYKRMVEHPQGTVVKQADYAALAARVESLEFDVEAMDAAHLRDQAEIKRLREALCRVVECTALKAACSQCYGWAVEALEASDE